MILGELVQSLIHENIKLVVMSERISHTEIGLLLRNNHMDIQTYIDSRSAGYAATGLCAESGKPVIFVLDNDNDSRNAYPAMTEAFYKKYPIIFVTIGSKKSVDYSSELKDTIVRTECYRENDTFHSSIISFCLENSLPVHIVISSKTGRISCDKDVSEIIKDLDKECNYLYVSNSFICRSKSKIRRNIAGGDDGIVSNILGASLSGCYNKYIGVCNDREMIHDLNALGNKYVNDRISFLVFGKNNIKMISDYAESLGFETYYGYENIENIEKIGKTIVFIEE